TLGGTLAAPVAFGGFVPAVGQTFVIINNDLSDAVSGTFAGLAEGALIPSFLGGTRPAQISYIGGSGNDVVLTVQATPGTLQFSSATYNGSEAGPNIALTVTRTGGTDNAVSAQVSFSGGTATGGAACGGTVDYVNTAQTVNFTAGSSTSQTVNVPICDDTVFEGSDETFNASLGTFTGGATAGTPSTSTVTINENDVQPTVQFSSATYTTAESLSGDGGVVTGINISVTRSGALGNTVTVDFGVNAGGTATGGAMCGPVGVDYVTPSGTLTFNPTDTTKMFFVEVCFDTIFEGDETVNLGLSNVTGGGTLGMPSTAVLTITDNDLPVITLDSSTYIQDESQTMVVTVQRSGTGSGTSSVQFTTGGGNATGGTCAGAADYETQNTTVTFTGTQTSQTVNIPICADMINEFPETFNITLSNPMNATLGSPSMAVATINEAATQFQNTNPIAITDGAVTSSVINVSGATSNIYYVRVTLFDISDDVADDLNFLLVGPGGQKFVLMADAGGTGAIGPGTTITFNDNSALFLPDATTISSGSYKPSSWELPASMFPAPAPAGPYAEPGPGGTPARSAFMNTIFGGLNGNGAWTLYVYDDNGGSLNQLAPGTIAGGWGIELIGPTAAGVSLSGRVTDAEGRGIRNALITIEGGGLTEPRITATGSMGYYNVEDLAIGTYIVTVQAKRHSFANPTRALSMSDNVAGFDFIAEP
ncbi:MAG: Calx-beta domain-containing protein, partial [Acidobacteriota bacterium]